MIAAQSDAEAKKLGINLPKDALELKGYDIDNFPYPEDWDSWPKEWDMELDKNLLRYFIQYSYGKINT